MASSSEQFLYQLLNLQIDFFVLDANSVISSALPPCLNEMDGRNRRGATLKRLSTLKLLGEFFLPSKTYEILKKVFVEVCEERRRRKEKRGEAVKEITEEELLGLLEATLEHLSPEIIQEAKYESYLETPLCGMLRKVDWEDAHVLAAAFYLREKGSVAVVSGDKHFGNIKKELEKEGLLLINPYKDLGGDDDNYMG